MKHLLTLVHSHTRLLSHAPQLTTLPRACSVSHHCHHHRHRRKNHRPHNRYRYIMKRNRQWLTERAVARVPEDEDEDNPEEGEAATAAAP